MMASVSERMTVIVNSFSPEWTHRFESGGLRPPVGAVLTTILLPPVLMMSRSLAQAFIPGEKFLKGFIEFVGDPIAALLIALFFAMYALGFKGFGSERLEGILNKSLGAIAAVVLIVGARRRFQGDVDLPTKISDLIGQWAARHTSRHSYWAGQPQPL